MSRTNRIPKGKSINPTFFVFCEGETEEKYICYLRTKYRLPIVIDAKVAGNRITSDYISNYKKTKINHSKDKTFLIYDLDVPEMLSKLQKIPDAIIIASNPCFELWFLLHYQEQKSAITTSECNSKLKEHHKAYKKGIIDAKLKEKLVEKHEKALHRASKLKIHENPSTQINLLIQNLDEVKMSKESE
ncbi:MAG: RloB family protein [Paludibacter sp.]|nr:RloB family protein [Paludibacter sp.]